MLITVTNDHIRRGKPCRPAECPVALAIREATGKDVSVIPARAAVGAYRAFGEYRMCPFPPSVTDWISCFDAGRQVEPFSFELLEGAA